MPCKCLGENVCLETERDGFTGNLDNSDLFIRSIRLRDDIEPKRLRIFSLNIDALRFFVSMRFTTPVTVFNGENVCCKSTLIETIAVNLDIPIVSGNKNLSGR